MPLVTPPTPAPESFVVRIYRRHARGSIAGTVEIVACGTERGFRSLRELQQILGLPARQRHGTKPEQGGSP